MMESTDPWIEAHSPIAAEKLHAIGVVIFEHNACDYWLNAFAALALSLKEEEARIVCHDMGPITLWAKVRDMAAAIGLDDESLAELEYAAKLYDHNNSNRNQLAHFAWRLDEGGPELLRLVKKRGSIMLGRGDPLPDTLGDIRRVAEEMSILRRYLADLLSAVHLRKWKRPSPPPWPKRPPLPKLLARHQIQTSAKRPRQPRQPRPVEDRG